MAISIPRYSVENLAHFPGDGNRYGTAVLARRNWNGPASDMTIMIEVAALLA